MKKLAQEFYRLDALTLAQSLLGKILVHHTPAGTTSGMIVETEAYLGPADKAAHSFNNRRTPRTEILFHAGGLAYVYLVYGLHCCLNVTAGHTGRPECVLLRALQPLAGLGIMQSRRQTLRPENLCSGPGKLCSAMGITREHNGLDLCGDELYIADNDTALNTGVSARIGIDYAEEWKDKPLRFFAEGSKYVSKIFKPILH